MFSLAGPPFSDVLSINFLFGPHQRVSINLLARVGQATLAAQSEHFPKRISEHYPTWLLKGECKTITSSIQEHLINCEHITAKEFSHKVIYTVK